MVRLVLRRERFTVLNLAWEGSFERHYQRTKCGLILSTARKEMKIA